MFITKASRRRPAFTLVEIMIVVAIIGLLAAIALPNFIKARAQSQANACINNLRKIDDASNQFAVEAHKSTGDHVSLNRDLTPYIKMNAAGKLPICPAHGTYGVESIGDTPVCFSGKHGQPRPRPALIADCPAQKPRRRVPLMAKPRPKPPSPIESPAV